MGKKRMSIYDNVSDYPYIHGGQIQDKRFVVTMSHVKTETLGNDRGVDVKDVLYFKGREKGLVLNKTNKTAIAGMYGIYFDEWAGERITLYAIFKSFFGKPKTWALRVDENKPAPKRTAKKAPVPQKKTTTDGPPESWSIDKAVRKMNAAGKKAYGDEWQEKRPVLVADVSNGAADMANQLTVEQVQKIIDIIGLFPDSDEQIQADLFEKSLEGVDDIPFGADEYE